MEQEPMQHPVNPAEPDRFLPGSILVAALMISAALIYTTKADTTPQVGVVGDNLNNNEPTVTANVSDPLPRDVVLGEADAPITLIEYGDYQCPFCARFFSQTEAQIRENYIKTGKVKMIYRDFAFLGPESTAAAEAAECAKDQGKFWAYHDALYVAEGRDNVEHNGNLNRDLFIKLANDTGMNIPQFTTCIDAHTYADNVTATQANASAVGVNGTPSTFVNGKAVEGGAAPYTTFQALFETYLKK